MVTGKTKKMAEAQQCTAAQNNHNNKDILATKLRTTEENYVRTYKINDLAHDQLTLFSQKTPFFLHFQFWSLLLSPVIVCDVCPVLLTPFLYYKPSPQSWWGGGGGIFELPCPSIPICLIVCPSVFAYFWWSGVKAWLG